VKGLRIKGIGIGIKRLPWKVALVLYAVLIFWLSSRPIPEGPTTLLRYDEFWHFFEYLLFGLLVWKASLPKSRKGLLLALSLSLSYAGSDELHQLFVPTRTASFQDWLLDGLGIGSGLLLGRFGFGGLHPRTFRV